MKAKLIGYKQDNYTRKDTGEMIEGTELYYSYKTSNVDLTGEEVAIAYANKGRIKLPALSVGKWYHIDTERSKTGRRYLVNIEEA